MKITCGTDIIEIERIKKAIETNENRFLNQIFTEQEVLYCEGRKNAKFQHYAARFAAKEAAFKALNEFIENKYDISWKNIEITNNKSGKPQINLKECNFEMIKSMDISISHCKEYAVANVIILYEEEANEII